MYSELVKNFSYDLDRFFEIVPSNTDVFSKSYTRSNIYADNEKLLTEILVAGIDPESIDISVRHNHLTIKGKQKKNRHASTENMPRLIKELHCPDLAHEIKIPFEFEEDQIKAELENGILSITVTKSEAKDSKKVPITLLN